MFVTDPIGTPPTKSFPRVRPQFALWPSLRFTRAPRDAWYFRAAGIVASALISVGILLAFDRLDLVTYTMAGSMTALFTHALPYRRRERTFAGFVVMLTIGCGLAMAAASASDAMLWRIVAASLLAAVIKVAHDASNAGAPSAVIPIFIVTALVFTPQTWHELPLHVALIAGAGVISWIVVMAPAVVRRDGPERRAVANAVLATIPVGANPSNKGARDALAVALEAARRGLSFAHGTNRAALEAHVVVSERILANPTLSVPDRARANAATIERARRGIPAPPLTEEEHAEIRGAQLAHAAPRPFSDRHPILATFRPSSPSAPYFWRLLLAGLVSALAAWALGGDRPFWAITAAAVIVQPNLLLTWRKAPPRALGGLIGVWLFALLAPLAHGHLLVAVLLILALNTLAEAFIVRSYLIGQLFVTPMALLMSQLGGPAPSGELILERSVDTIVGVVAGLAAAFVIRNGHLRRHAKTALARLERAAQIPDELDVAGVLEARSELVGALAAVAAAVRTSDDEWWTHRVDEQRVMAAQKRAHEVLAQLG